MSISNIDYVLVESSASIASALVILMQRVDTIGMTPMERELFLNARSLLLSLDTKLVTRIKILSDVVVQP